jgi:GAF domain-containing protein
MPLGEKIGTLCVIDTETKQLTDVQRKDLEGLAKLVAQSLTMRYNLLKQLDPSLEYDVDFPVRDIEVKCLDWGVIS